MLKGIGLGHLAEKFKTEGIDLKLVLDMGSGDLRRMMVDLEINWGARVKNPRNVKHWLDPGTWDEYSYTRKYLEYKIEEGQVDLTNPFHIEESNKLRSRLVKKSKVNFM